MSTKRVDPIADFKRELTHTKRARHITLPGVEMEKLTLGPVKLQDGHQGHVTRLYNEGTLGLFEADNGPIFTITAADLKAPSAHDTLAEIFATLKRVQTLCQA